MGRSEPEYHLDLLAPGVPLDRFVLVTNDLDAGLRTVAFEQRAAVAGTATVPVVGGRFSVRFKNDRLFVFASEAIAAGATLPSPRIAGTSAEHAARAWIAKQHGVTALAEGASLAALPLAQDGRTSLRLVYRVVIEAGAPRARYAVFVDAVRGALVAREQLLRFAASEVTFDAPVRAPKLGRQPYPRRPPSSRRPTRRRRWSIHPQPSRAAALAPAPRPHRASRAAPSQRWAPSAS